MGGITRRVLTDVRLTMLAVVLVIVVPLFGFRLLALHQSELELRARESSELSDAANAILANERERLARLQDRLRGTWAAAPMTAFADASSVMRTLQEVERRGGSDVVGAALVDAGGRILASDPVGFANVIPAEKLRPQEREEEVEVSPFVQLDGHTFFVLSVPVDADRSVFVGMDAQSALRDMRSVLGVFGSVYLIDDQGIALSVTRYAQNADFAGAAGDDLDLLACCGAATGAIADPAQLYGEAKLNGGEWRIVIGEPKASVDAIVGALGRTLLLTGLIPVALLLVATLLLSLAFRRTLLQHERLREVQEVASVAGWSWDLRRSRFSGPVGALRMLGLPELANGTVEELLQRVHTDDRPRLSRSFADAIEHMIPPRLHCRIVAGDGKTRVIEIRAACERDAGGRCVGLRGTAQDVTETYRNEEQRALLLAEIDSIDEAVVVTALDGTITEWNSGAERLFGWSRAEAFESPIAMLRPPALREGPVGSKLALVRMGRVIDWSEGQRVRKDGSVIEVAAKGTPVRDESGQVIAASWTYRDIGRQKALEAELAERASHDALTGLPNRFLLRDRLDQSLRQMQRSAGSLALLEVDVEGFGELNDAIGVQGGDALLMDMAARLQAEVRSVDTVARVATDIFAIVVPGADTDAAALVASRLHAALATPFQYGRQEVDVNVSIGIVIAPAHGNEVDVLLHRCETALLSAKRSGARYALYATDRERDKPSRVIVLTELRQAIERNELTLEYQPEVDVRSGQMLRAEALVRWVHPTRGVLAPVEFIPIVEDTGLIGPLTWWVLGEATRQCRAWQEGGAKIPVAINLSARSLLEPELVERIAGALSATGLSGDLLTIEITEGVLMTDAARAREVIDDLHALGVRLALDDFGTGYSSFAYLDTLPIDALKIDKSFITGLGHERGETILRTMIDLGHHLGFEVVAEGVESDGLVKPLIDLGCDTLQGYAIGRPMRAADLETWLRDGPPPLAPRVLPRSAVWRGRSRGHAPAV